MRISDGSSDVCSSDLTEAEQVLDNILLSQRAFKTYNDFCDRIDRIYSDRDDLGETLGVIGLTDRRYDLFWSSIEVLKPAIYAKQIGRAAGRERMCQYV